MAPCCPSQAFLPARTGPVDADAFLCGVCLGEDVPDSWDPAILRPGFSQ